MDASVAARTRELFTALGVRKPPLTDALLSRPPFKFLVDVVAATNAVVGGGLLANADDPLLLVDVDKAGASRDSKLAYLDALLGFLKRRADGAETADLTEVKPAKIVAGREPELTNRMLQRLAESALAYRASGADSIKKSSSSKAARSTHKERDDNGEARKRKSKASSPMKEPSSSTMSREQRHADGSRRHQGEGEAAGGDREEKERRERRHHHTDGHEKSASTAKESKSGKSRKNGAMVEYDSTTKKKRETSSSRKTIAADIEASSSSAMTKKPSGASKTTKKAKRNIEAEVDEGISVSPKEEEGNIAAGPSTPPPERESSGGTSKGGEDSGIAEEMESARRRSANTSSSSKRRSTTMPPPTTTPRGESAETTTILKDGPRDSISAVASIARPMTAGAVRPQTALGRPGTAMARAAPPRIKRTKVADIDPTVVAALPQSANAASALMLEPEMTTAVIGDSETTTRKGAVAANEINEFLVEEGDEEEQLLLGGAGEVSSISAAAKALDSDEHGQLVQRILENTRELEKSGAEVAGDSLLADPHEQRRMREEIAAIQRALQSTTATLQPLARCLEAAVDDFDALLKEIEEARRETARCERLAKERRNSGGGLASNSDHAAGGGAKPGGAATSAFALAATLRQVEAECVETRRQIGVARANVMANERRLEAAMGLQSNELADASQELQQQNHLRLWQHIVENLQTNHLFLILKYLISEHRERHENAVVLRRHFSIYRDILFVALDRFSRSVDRDQFDRQFQVEVTHLPPRICALLSPADHPPQAATVACRRIFMPLDVL